MTDFAAMQDLEPTVFRALLAHLWVVELDSISDERFHEAKTSVIKILRADLEARARDEALQTWALEHMSPALRRRILSRVRQRQYSFKKGELATTHRITVSTRLLEMLEQVRAKSPDCASSNGELLLRITKEWLRAYREKDGEPKR